jgi:uncharacterized membrane protein
MNYWPLLGVALIVAGFMRRWNPVLVVVGAGVVTGLAADMGPLRLLESFGEGFARNRYLALFLLTLPVLGVLERHGLREHAQQWIAKRRELTLGRLLMFYLALRQASAALGLTSLGGQAQTVRPLLAPMAEGAASRDGTPLDAASAQQVRAMAAATDNVGLFFGEDIFIAFGAVLLIRGVYADHGIPMEPLQIALWGIPTALCAFAIHAWRLQRFDRRIAAAARQQAAAAPAAVPATGSAVP